MALIIEDGTQVTGANSYITEAEYTAWANARFGAARTTLPADTAAYEAVILRAMDYFESLEFKGELVSIDQPLQWPRNGVYIDNYYVPSDTIAPEVKKALYELTYAEEQGQGELNAIDRKVMSETVGPISVTYASGSASRVINVSTSRALRKLTKAGGYGSNNFSVSRG